jgi:hypothetical protein
VAQLGLHETIRLRIPTAGVGFADVERDEGDGLPELPVEAPEGEGLALATMGLVKEPSRDERRAPGQELSP